MKEQKITVLGNVDFKVNTFTGEATISQRKLAVMCGVNQSTINQYFRSAKADVKQGVTPILAIKAIGHYAEKGKDKAIKSLVRISEYGMDQSIKKIIVGYEKQLSPMEILKKQVAIMEAQEDRIG